MNFRKKKEEEDVVSDESKPDSEVTRYEKRSFSTAQEDGVYDSATGKMVDVNDCLVRIMNDLEEIKKVLYQ